MAPRAADLLVVERCGSQAHLAAYDAAGTRRVLADGRVELPTARGDQVLAERAGHVVLVGPDGTVRRLVPGTRPTW